jgi:signal transduction histidine kinase/CheY-like chemotaxis protein
VAFSLAPDVRAMMPVDLAAAAAATLADLMGELVEERRHLEMLLSGIDLIEQGIIVIDGDLKLAAASRGFFRLFGFPLELSHVGTPLADLVRHNASRGEYGKGDVDEIVAEQLRIAREFKAYDLEHIRPDGSIIAIRCSPLPQGGSVTVYTDITEQRAHERLIRERNDAMLAHAQKMEAVGQLAGGLAHDFNNLLTIVMGNLAELRDSATKAGTIECVDRALAAAKSGASVTRRLLAFARRQTLEPRIVEVNNLIANLLSLSRPSLPSSIRFSTQPAPFELYARVDSEQLEQAFLNLVLNARDAMPGGGSLMVHSASRLIHNTEAGARQIVPGRYVEIRVEDNGTGMDEATRSRAFEPFFTSKQAGSGSGLGLSMVYGFVQQSGGTAYIDSAPGKGTTVTLLLPASLVPTGSDLLRSRGPGVSAHAAPRGRVGSPRHVLLVDDNSDVRAVIRRQLHDMGHIVIEAAAGDKALAAIDKNPQISALVSDIVMPGAINGRRLADLAKQRRPELRVVLVTGYADGLDVKAAQGRSFTVLRKPCTKDELAAAIEAAPQ